MEFEDLLLPSGRVQGPSRVDGTRPEILQRPTRAGVLLEASFAPPTSCQVFTLPSNAQGRPSRYGRTDAKPPSPLWSGQIGLFLCLMMF